MSNGRSLERGTCVSGYVRPGWGPEYGKTRAEAFRAYLRGLFLSLGICLLSVGPLKAVGNSVPT